MKMKKQDFEKTWNIIAKSFDKTRSKPWDFVIDYINCLDENLSTADFGCGNGRHLIPLAKKSKISYGIDFSEELLKIVKKKLLNNDIKNVRLLKNNLGKIELKKNSLDSIIFIASLHNIKGRENRINALKEVKRILKPGKTALISVWSREQDKFKYLLKKDEKNEYGDVEIFWHQDGLDIPRFYHLYSKKELKSEIKEAELVLLKIKDLFITSKNKADNYYVIIQS